MFPLFLKDLPTAVMISGSSAFLAETPLSMIVVLSPACHPAVVCSTIWIVCDNQLAAASATTLRDEVISYALFRKALKEVSPLHIQCYGSWPDHSLTERENTAPWCHIDNGAILDSHVDNLI